MPDPTKEERDRMRAGLESDRPSELLPAAFALQRYAPSLLDAADERDRLSLELHEVLCEVQRHQPNGSPPPGGPAALTTWVLAELRTERDRLRAEVGKLRDALQPFAAYVDFRGSGMPDEAKMDPYAEVPNLGHCRKAKEVLGAD